MISVVFFFLQRRGWGSNRWLLNMWQSKIQSVQEAINKTILKTTNKDRPKSFHNSKIFITLIVGMSSQFPVLLLMMEFTSLSKMSHGLVLFLNCQKFVIYCLFRSLFCLFYIMWNTHQMISVYFFVFLDGYRHNILGWK